MLLFATRDSTILAQGIADALGRPLAKSEEREYDGGEHKMRPLEDVRGREVFVVQSLAADERASANDKLCRLLFFAGALQDAGAARVTACLPYLAYARKDRRTQPRDPVTIRYVAALFEAVGIDRVIVLDVHNEAAFDNAFRCETIRLEAAELFVGAVASLAGSSRIVVASPDIGGIKRAQRLRAALADALACEIDFAFMEKQRARGVVSGDRLVGDVAGSEVLLYDDLISSGTTVLRAAEAARQSGATRVHVIATHAVFQPAAARLFEGTAIASVLVSDSAPLAAAFRTLSADRLRICRVAPLFARTVLDLTRASG